MTRLDKPTTHWNRSAAPARTACAALAAAASSIWTAPGAALEWSYAPTVSVGASEDTNIALEPVAGRRVSSASLAAASNIVGRNEALRLSFTPRITSLRYDDDRELDRDSRYADLELARDGERQHWSLGGQYAHEGTLTSELESTGFIASDVDRVQSSVNGTWSRAVSERGGVSLDLSSITVDYGVSPSSSLVDYDYRIAQAAYSLQTSERSSWSFSVGRSQYVTGSPVNTTVTSTVRATWSRRFSNVLQAHIGFGGFDAAADGPFGVDHSGGSLSFGMQRSWERWSFSTDGGRDLQPDGRGAMVVEDLVTVGMTRRLGERLRVGASARATEIASQVGLEADFRRRYSQAGVNLGWSFARGWSLDVSLSERTQGLRSTGAEGSGRIGQIMTSYRGR